MKYNFIYTDNVSTKHNYIPCNLNQNKQLYAFDKNGL